MKNRWYAVELELAREIVDEMGGSLAEGALGSQVVEAGADRALLRIYYDDDLSAAAGADRARRFLGPRQAAPIFAIEDGAWVERYQRALKPFPAGRRFLVNPGGTADPGKGSGGRMPILLAPGRAFGTGEHPTTRLCIEELEVRVRPGSCWFDLGCGSGILAIAASRLGADTVTASDCDAEAVAVAQRAVRVNGLDGVVLVKQGSITRRAGGGWDGIVCNIEAPFFVRAADDLARSLAADGLLLAAGLLVSDRPAVGRALGEAGLVEVAWRELDGWGLLVASGGRKVE